MQIIGEIILKEPKDNIMTMEELKRELARVRFQKQRHDLPERP